MSSDQSVLQSVERYLQSVSLARSPNTARTYRNALQSFLLSLEEIGIEPQNTRLDQVSVDWIVTFIESLKAASPATERLYLTAAANWFEYLAAEEATEVNLPRLRLLIRQRARRPGLRLPQFPRNAIETILHYAQQLNPSGADERQALIILRDRAFLLLLADSGLRVHEAVNLRRGDLDWSEARALLIGKGDRQAVVRFSQRSLKALKAYLEARRTLDGASGKPLAALALFARHDKGAGRKVLPISTTTGRAIVAQRTGEALGEDAVGSVTPHSFRHYFVTTVLRGSGGNLKLAQELARHKSIAITQRYAHLSDDELDRGYHEIFN